MAETNPLLASLKLPGRMFQLPSRGVFYKNGELDPSIKDGELHVHALSAMDEINLKNPDQLFSGQAVNSVFPVCVDGILKPSELLSKDVDAITLFLRVVTYGPDYEFIARHRCEGGKDHGYIANVEQMIATSKMLDPTEIVSMYSITMPNGQVVQLRPSRYQNVLDILKANENKKEITADDQRKNLQAQLMSVVASVDGISDADKLEEWVKSIPGPMVNRIAKKIETVNDWGPNLRWTCKCKDCGQDFEVDVPINPVSFFTE